MTTLRRSRDEAMVAMASALQREALHPQQQVWISANAGTGKTEVLTRRLVALLLNDPSCEPQAILALTFTNAGAAEMASRLPRKLAALAALDDVALQIELANSLGITLTPAIRERLNDVLNQVVVAPPMIRTIHGFAKDLLQRFSSEAREVMAIPPNFTILEPAEAARLLREAQALALGESEPAIATAVDLLLAELGEAGWQDLTRLTSQAWPKISGLLKLAGGARALGEQLATSLGISTDATAVPAAPLPTLDLLRQLKVGKPLQGLLHDVMTLRGQADDLTMTQRETLIQALQNLWCTKEVRPRKDVLLKTAARDDPALAAQVNHAQQDFMQWLGVQAAWHTLAMTKALLRWGTAVQAAYAALKQAAGALDYQDLLDAAEALLTQEEGDAKAWVLYRLDRRFRHLLVDEAQDNNAQQARLVQVLADELLAAQGADGLPRTVLAVGDMKQSVYRFQGAQPQYFLALRERLNAYAPPLADGRAGFKEVNLQHSFRSGRTVLALVDAVFAEAALAAAVTGEPAEQGKRVMWPTHQSVFGDQPGRVEVWPLVPHQEQPKVLPWTLPMVRAAQDASANRDNAKTRCLRQVALRLVDELAAAPIVPSSGRALQPGDILILTQRNSVAESMRQELRALGLPVAGGVLTLAVPALQDFVALLKLLHNPTDKLSLATFLKSPLPVALGSQTWTDTALLALAKAGPDWMGELGQRDAVLAATLQTLQVQAGLLTPAALVARLWQQLSMATRYARQAVEVADLTAAGRALQEIAAKVTTLTALLARVEDDDFTVELPASGGEVEGIRVMTTFKAKGLEAPLVILVETSTPLAKLSQEKFAWLEHHEQLAGVLYRAPGEVAANLPQRLLADSQETIRKQADSLRQLYVALTRARDWVWVTGWQYGRKAAEEDDQASDSNTWYGLISQAMRRLPGVESFTLPGSADENQQFTGLLFAEGAQAMAWAAPEERNEEHTQPARNKADLTPLDWPLWEDTATPAMLLSPQSDEPG